MEEGCFGHFVQKTHSPFEHTSKVVLRLWDAPFGIRGHLSFISFIWWNCVKKLLMLKAFLPKPTNTNMTKQTWYYSSLSWLCLPITRASLWAGLLQCRFQIQATKFSYSKSETSYKSSLPGCNPRAQRAKHIVERRDQANLTNNIILMVHQRNSLWLGGFTSDLQDSRWAMHSSTYSPISNTLIASNY